MILRHHRFSAVLFPALGLLAACSAGGPQGGSEQAAPSPAPTMDAATRSQPVVAGRPARLFVFAGWEANCAPLPAPEVKVTEVPAQGDVSFRPGQETTIAASAAGTCSGQKATGTGVYYTARAGAQGRDRFAVEARLASGEVATRVFEVEIAQ